jgi:hypothetical protein
MLLPACIRHRFIIFQEPKKMDDYHFPCLFCPGKNSGKVIPSGKKYHFPDSRSRPY